MAVCKGLEDAVKLLVGHEQINVNGKTNQDN